MLSKSKKTVLKIISWSNTTVSVWSSSFKNSSNLATERL
jgi:hypothetical protein